MSDILIYKEQIEDVFVLKSVYELDMLNKADIDGNLTIGGIWFQDGVLTDRFTGNKQVWTAFTNNTLEIGNVSLNKVTLTANGINSFKAKVGTVEYTMYHSGNLNLDIYALTDGSNAEGELAFTIENSHTHSNKALLDSYNQTNADITDAVSKRHTHPNKAILDAITAAFTTADDNLLNALGGLQFESDQTNAVLRIKDGNGSVLTSISLAYLNNEGTKFSYNSTNNTLDLLNDAGEVLSSIPVSSFVTNLVKSVNWNGSTPYRLDFKDNAGTILFSIDYTINNIQGLQAALNLKQDRLTAGANVQISPTNVISATDTIYTHPNSGVVAGSYNNVTVNAQGHVVEASNVNYALANQIPTVNNGQLSFSVFTDHFTNAGFTFSANQSTNTTATQLKLNQGIIDKVGQGATAYSQLSNKANIDGSNISPTTWSNLTSGNSDKWDGQHLHDTVGTSPYFFMLRDDSSYDWYTHTPDQVKNLLGLSNPTLQTVTNNGNSTTLGATFNGVTIGFSGSSFKGFDLDQDFSFLLNSSDTNRILTGGVLASNSYADASLIPTNGIYSKGNVIVPNAISNNHAVNLGQLNNKVSKTGDTISGDLGMLNGVKFKFKAPSDPTHYIWNNPITDFDEINISTGFQIIDYATGLPLFSTQNVFNQSFRNLIVPAGIADAHAVNLGQLNNALADIPETILANKVGFVHLNQSNTVTNEVYYNNEAPLNIQFQDTDTVKITATTDGVNTKYRFDSNASLITHDAPLDNYLAGGGNNAVKVISHVLNDNFFQSPTDGNVLFNDAISLVGLWDDYREKAVLRGEVQVNTSLQSYINAGKRYLVFYGEINSLGTQIDYQDCNFYTLIEIANMKLAVGEKNFIVKVGEIMNENTIYVNTDLM